MKKLIALLMALTLMGVFVGGFSGCAPADEGADIETETETPE